MIVDYFNQRVQIEITDFDIDQTDYSITFGNLRTVYTNAIQNYPDMEIVFPAFPNNEICLKINNYIPINLGKKKDFNNQTIKVTRDPAITGAIYLFKMEDESFGLNFRRISKKDVDSGQFHHIDELKEGLKLVRLKDYHFWTYHSTLGNIYREDILLIKNGQAMNTVIAPYDTNGTLLNSSYCDTDDSEKWFKNLTVIRPLNPGTGLDNCFTVITGNQTPTAGAYVKRIY